MGRRRVVWQWDTGSPWGEVSGDLSCHIPSKLTHELIGPKYKLPHEHFILYFLLHLRPRIPPLRARSPLTTDRGPPLSTSRPYPPLPLSHLTHPRQPSKNFPRLLQSPNSYRRLPRNRNLAPRPLLSPSSQILIRLVSQIKRRHLRNGRKAMPNQLHPSQNRKICLLNRLLHTDC